jgi:uncharacterized repeat protein (TIGR04076 family)
LLEVKVVEVRGYCPVHKVGDTIMVVNPRIVLEKTDALCTHALSSLLHYVVALERGVDPVQLGLSKPENKNETFIQCADPGKPYTHGGTVIFRIRKIEDK